MKPVSTRQVKTQRMTSNVAMRTPLILLLISSLGVAAEEHRFKPDAEIAGYQWEVLDLAFGTKSSQSKPFDQTFQAEFRSNDGKSAVIAGFYNGNNEYLLRWTPPTVGMWQFQTKSSLPELNGLSGKVNVQRARTGRRGGIVVDESSNRRFRFENGERYFPIAFEADWLFALDAENEQGIPDTEVFVEYLAASGFNQVVMNVFAYDVNWEKDPDLPAKYEYGSPDVFPFKGNNTRPQYDRLNATYFRRLDRVIECLDRHGIVAHLMIYVWNKQVNWPEAQSKADNQYFDYVVKRYQAYPNLIWDISKEALGYGHTDVHYITERIERLRKLDQYQRLITVHDYGYCRRFSENVDFVSVQLWLSELYSVMRNVCREIPGKPILNIEHGGYERSPYVVFTGNYTSPEVCLERAYQCVFAGTYPTHYWQGAAWNVFIPRVDELPKKDRPKLGYYKHLHQLVEKYALGELKAGDKKSNAGFSLHNDQDLFIYYVPKECDFIGLRLPSGLQGRMMSGTWFNPFDGSYSEPQEKEIVKWPAFEVPAGEGFRILILKILPKS